MPTTEQIEKLRGLRVFPQSPNTVGQDAGIFEKSRTLDDVTRELGQVHSGCGTNQFLYFHLEALFKADSGYKTSFLEKAIKQLESSGISPEHIAEYFSGQGKTGIGFVFEHEDEYGMDMMNAFFEQADQFALDKFRQWIGYT